MRLVHRQQQGLDAVSGSRDVPLYPQAGGARGEKLLQGPAAMMMTRFAHTLTTTWMPPKAKPWRRTSPARVSVKLR
ncbi:hypothetical protein ACFWP5_25955 [Streptomyces sp. NPDC058469]|uniref:hypothetical protein n=1 Tax=Streptomyces sp. NPDC058469 TaxID=3346514 RepID=UPI0036658DB0